MNTIRSAEDEPDRGRRKQDRAKDDGHRRKKKVDSGPAGWLDRYFGVSAAGTTFPREARAGVVTFLTMSYILFVNPEVLGAAIDVPNGQVQLLMTTAMAACFGCLAMGLIARYPFALAPGMGLNAFFAYTVVLGMDIPWQTALGAVFISGVLFILLSVVGARRAIVQAIPNSLKLAIMGGIGCFLAFLGLRNAGLVVTDEATLVTLGDLTAPSAWLALVGLALIAILLKLRVKGALLWGILATSLVAIFSGAEVFDTGGEELGAFTGFSDGIVALPVWPEDLVGQLDIVGALGIGFFNVIFTFFFVDFFDATGTLTGLSKKAGYLDERGNMPRAKTTFSMDGLSSIFGSLMGTSTTGTYVESASGIQDGGRTGITSVVTGGLFVAAMFFWPLTSAIPGSATAPALILVGAMMMDGIRHIDWDDISEGVPSFLTVITMPLTFSIADGVSIGVISYCVIQLFTGDGRKVSPVLYLVAALLVLRYMFFTT